jgi:transposase
MYEKFLKSVCKIKYTAIKPISLNADTDEVKNIRKIVISIIMYLINKNILVLFYDESLVSDDSFKRHVWKKSNKKVYMPINKSTGTINFLLIASNVKLENFWVTRKANTHIVTSFLNETVNFIRERDGKIPIVIFLDNCKSHKTNLIKDFANNKQVYLLFNSPNSSKINMIEFLFEKAKRLFRVKCSKNRGEIIGKVIDKELRALVDNDIRIAWERTIKEMTDCMNNKNMWSN